MALVTCRKFDKLTKCRLEFSSLNEHKFGHYFYCINLLCNCGMTKEDNKHFFLHCPIFHQLRQDLLGQLSYIEQRFTEQRFRSQRTMSSNVVWKPILFNDR